MTRPLRVLMVSQSYHPHWGGIGEHARHLAIALIDRGHDVAVVAPGPAPARGELPGPRVLRVGRSLAIPSNGTRARIGWSFAYGASIPPILHRGWDIVHIHSPFEPFLPWAVLAMAEVPCVATFHNAGEASAGYRVMGGGLRPLASRLAARIAVSPSATRYVERFFPGAYTVVPNGVDPRRFHPGIRPRETKEEARILCVGRLERRKGIDVLLHAVSILQSRGTRLNLVIVGDGSLRASLRRLAGALEVHATWLGDVSAEDIARIYRKADVLAAPARFGESFGIVLLEALASGVPVVAAANDGYRDLLEGCGAATVVDAGDPAALADGLDAAMAHPEPEAVRSTARSFALRFAWNRIAESVEGVYSEVLGAGAIQARRLPPAEGRARVLARSIGA